MMFECENAADVLRYFDDFIADAPREYGGFLVNPEILDLIRGA